MKFEIGIRAHDVNIFNDPRKLFLKLKAMKVKKIQLAPAKSFPELTNDGAKIPAALAQQIQASSQATKIKIAVLGCYVNLIHPDVVRRDQALDRIKDYLMMANRLGARTVATETGSIDPNFSFTTDNFEAGPYQSVIDSIQQVIPTEEENNINFAIEPGINHPIYSVETTRRVLSDIKSTNLKVLLDPASLVYQGKNTDEIQIIKDAFNQFGDKIVAVHLKDYVFNDAGLIKIVVPGKGVAPLRDLIVTLNKIAPDVPVLFDELPPDTAAEAINMIEKITASI